MRTFSLLSDFINKDYKGENFLQKIKNITKYDLTFYKNIFNYSFVKIYIWTTWVLCFMCLRIVKIIYLALNMLVNNFILYRKT